MAYADGAYHFSDAIHPNEVTLLSLMNSTTPQLSMLNSNCSLKARVYTSPYLFFKLINATYLRVLVGPGVLLNIICLVILTRPRLSNKSTTIVFLRLLAVFDILAISLKYIRAEINYQSLEKGHEIFLLIPSICKGLYVLMNASISIAMWTIVLMSLDKAIAVSFPLKASIWLTNKRVFYVCCVTIGILLFANLSFINLSGIKISRTNRRYCGLNKVSFVVDLLTASMLPMALITAANVVIAIVLHRNSFDWRASDDASQRSSEANLYKRQISSASGRQHCSAISNIGTMDAMIANKRRTNAQVTRMLLAVTLSLIICNIPNTVFFIVDKTFGWTQIIFGRACTDLSDFHIELYRFGIYSSIVQDILSDLPHIFNFFLYCLAGKKFRNIFVTEVRQFLADIHLIKSKDRRSTYGTCYINMDSLGGVNLTGTKRTKLSKQSLVKERKNVEVLLNGNKISTQCTEEQDALIQSKNELDRTRKSIKSNITNT